MKNILIALTILSFGLGFTAANAGATRDAVVAACKSKAAGTQVTVNGKQYVCPKA